MLFTSDLNKEDSFCRSLELIELLAEHGFGIVNLHGVDPVTGGCSCKRGLQCEAKGKHPYRYGWQKHLALGHANVMNLIKMSIGAFSAPLGEHTHYIRSNIGVVCGGESRRHPGKYLVIVDIDDNQEMIDRLDALEEQTVNYFTGSGGKHYLYLSDKPINNSVSGIAPGVDIRGAGGYAIIPPSSNAKGDYSRIGPSLIIRELPEFLRRDLAILCQTANRKKSSKPTDTQTEKKTKKSSDEKNTPEEIQKRSAVRDRVLQLIAEKDTVIPCGMRNQTLYIYLCQLRAKGALKGKLFDAAREMIATRFEAPETFSEHELTTLVSSVATFKPTVHTHDEMLRVFFEWAVKNNTIPARYGKRTFDFRRDIYRLDREFFQVRLPEAITESIRTNGCGLLMSEIVSLRDQYYTNLGFATSQYLRLSQQQVGLIFSHDCPFYKVFDKVRNKVRRYEWYLLEKEYDEFITRKRSDANSDDTPTSPSSPSLPEEKKEEENSTLSGFTNSTSIKALKCSTKCRIQRGCRGSGLLVASLVCPMIIPPSPTITHHAPPPATRSDTTPSLLSLAHPAQWPGDEPVAAHELKPPRSGVSVVDLTGSERCARCCFVTNNPRRLDEEGKSIHHGKIFEDDGSAEQLAGTPRFARGGCSAWRFRSVEHGREALLPVYSSAHGSGIAPAGDWADLQRTDHKARGECEDRGQLSLGDRYGISVADDEFWCSGSGVCQADRGDVEGCVCSGDRECGACSCGRWVRQDGCGWVCGWIGQPVDHPGRRYRPIFSSAG